MNFRFRLGQLSQGFGHQAARQSFLWMAPFSPARMTALWHPDLRAAGFGNAAFDPIDDAALRAGNATGADRLLHQFLLTYLPDDILMKSDRAAMFNSLEVRSPFLHRPLADYAASLPFSLKYRAGSAKYILKQVARKYLPEAIVTRKKHGFAVPIGNLIRGIFRHRVRDTLASPGNPVANWFDRAEVDAMLTDHMSGRADHGKRLWALFILFTVAAGRAHGRTTMPHSDIQATRL